MKRKTKDDIRTFFNSDRAILMSCIGIALVFWLLVKLSQSYKTTEDYEISYTLPEGKTFVVKDQSNATNIYFNIPAKPNMDDVELNEDQLDIVAGGGGTNSPIIIVNGVSDVTVEDGGS